MAATDTQQAGETSVCTFPEVKRKDLTGVLTKAPKLILLSKRLCLTGDLGGRQGQADLQMDFGR